MRPRGLGLRLKSRQFQPVKTVRSGGARWPFAVVAFPLVALIVCASSNFAGTTAAAAAFLEVMRCTVRVLMGDRLRVRDLR